MTHKSADCLERPRARGAKFTGKHIAADDKIDEISLTTYDSKRDRYNGYDIEEYAKVVDRYEAVDAVRQVSSLIPGGGGAAGEQRGARGGVCVCLGGGALS